MRWLCLKRFLFLLVFVFLLLLVYGPCSFGYGPNLEDTDWTSFNYNGNTIDFINGISNQCFGQDLDTMVVGGQNATKLSNFYTRITDYNTIYIYTIKRNSTTFTQDPNSFFVGMYNNWGNGYLYQFYENKNSQQVTNLSVQESSQSNSGNINGTITGEIRDKYVILNANSLGQFYKSINNINSAPQMNLIFYPHSDTQKEIQGVTFYIQQMSRNFPYIDIGSLYNFNNILNVTGSVYQFTDAQNFNNFICNTDNSIDGEQVKIDSVNLLYKQGYAVQFRDGDYLTPFYYFYFVAPGTDINNFSGEIINTDNDNNMLQPILQQNEDNNNFWKDTYNSLFTLNSGDFSEISALVSSYIPSGDTPISIYDTIFGSLNNEPSDFIIRWDDIPFKATMFGGTVSFSGDFISANSVNFSKLVRENDTFKTIHYWIRILSIFGFWFATFITLYKCIIAILGTTSAFIDIEIEPEHRQVGFINDWRDKS